MATSNPITVEYGSAKLITNPCPAEMAVGDTATAPYE